MARGMIGLASPISATGVLVPVVYGLARGESPSLLQLAGVVLAIGGVLLAVQRSQLRRERATRDGVSVLFAAGAALGFGTLFVGVSFAAKHTAPWAVCAVRAGGCGVIVAGALLAHRPLRARELELRGWRRSARSMRSAAASTRSRRHSAASAKPRRRRCLAVSGVHGDPRHARGARAPRAKPARRSCADADRDRRDHRRGLRRDVIATRASFSWASELVTEASGQDRGADLRRGSGSTTTRAPRLVRSTSVACCTRTSPRSGQRQAISQRRFPVGTGPVQI